MGGVSSLLQCHLFFTCSVCVERGVGCVCGVDVIVNTNAENLVSNAVTLGHANKEVA